MAQQTAVEWLQNELLRLEMLDGYSMFEIFEKAKEIEKQQSINDYKHGQNNGYMYGDGVGNIIEAEQYYKEIYGS